jgi:hypothetical protein
LSAGQPKNLRRKFGAKKVEADTRFSKRDIYASMKLEHLAFTACDDFV